MDELNEKFLEKLVSTPRASGYEFKAQQKVKKYLECCVDDLYGDRIGNLYSVINPDRSFKIMLAGHIDQIGFQITHIDKDGFLWFLPLGSFDYTTLPGKRVILTGENGSTLGLIGKKSINLMKPEEKRKVPTLEELFIDIGCKTKEDAEKKVNIGDFAVFDYGYQRLGEHNFAVAAGFDDSIGAFIVAEVMKELSKDKNFYAGVYGVTTVQEEIGIRGAAVAAHNLNPDVGIIFDVGHTTDNSNISKKQRGDLKLDEGPILTIGPDANPELLNRIIKIAEENDIPYQKQAWPIGTGTDTSAIMLSGAATALISIPNRYMHTPSEVISLNDVVNIITLVVLVIRSITEEDLFIPL